MAWAGLSQNHFERKVAHDRNLAAKKGRPNYYVLLRYKEETTGKERQKWVSTDIPVKGNNKRKAEQRREEVLSQAMRESVDLSKDI